MNDFDREFKGFFRLTAGLGCLVVLVYVAVAAGALWLAWQLIQRL